MTGAASEVTAAIVHPGGTSSLAADLRVRLLREHLNLHLTDTDAELRDPDTGLGLLNPAWSDGRTAPDTALQATRGTAAADLEPDIISNWTRVSRAGIFSPRSAALQRVDTAVAALAQEPHSRDRLRAVLEAIQAWQQTQTGPSVRDTAIRRLRERIEEDMRNLLDPIYQPPPGPPPGPPPPARPGGAAGSASPERGC
jgi:hypothetical protein